MTDRVDGTLQNKLSLRDQLYTDHKYQYDVPVELFLEYYAVSSPEVVEILKEHPTLCYLLGNVTEESQREDSRPDGVMRPVYFLTEGSAMFALGIKEDAMRWRGIFNHIMGTARQVYYLASRLKDLSPEQKVQFAQLGFDISSFGEINPELLRDFMFISHARRRETDEKTWHNLDDDSHKQNDPGKATAAYLETMHADLVFLDLMRVEKHADHLAKVAILGGDPLFANIIDNILTYCDWTFGQMPNTLVDRFNAMRKSQRQPPEMLSLLENCGARFESALKTIVSPTIWEDMSNAGPYDWETKIRKAYCAPSRLKMEEVFLGYVKQFPDTVEK